MSIFKNKKISAALFAAIMVLSVFALLGLSAQPAYGASGSVSYNPTVFSSGKSTLVVANGGSFSPDATVTFYISSTNSFTASSTKVGSYLLTSGSTTLSNAVVILTIPSETPGSYYLAASDDNGATFTSAFPITVTSLTPSLTVSSTVGAGNDAVVTGSQFDPGSTLNIYLGYAGGEALAYNVEASTGYFTTNVTIPQTVSQSSNPTYIVAQETSSSSPNDGLTAYASFTLQATISVTPTNIAPSQSSTVTVTGYGFASNAVISPNSVTLSAQFGSITDVTSSAATTNSKGEFSLAVTFDSINAYGPVSIGISTNPSSSPSSFSDAFYVSQPNASKLGFIFAAVPTTGSTYNPGDAVTATVYNFPASQSVQISLGSTSVGTITTSGNGYGQLVAVIPAIPAGAYAPTAVASSMGLYAQSSTITISPYFSVSNPSNAMLTTSTLEYIPSDAMLTVSAYGLTPTTAYDVYDSLAAQSGVYANGLVTSIEVGTNGTAGIYPASNGTLIFTYIPHYTTKASTSSTITMSGGVPSYGFHNFGYNTIGTPSIYSPSPFKILTQTSTQTLSITGLIPLGAAVYPGITYYYSAFIGSTPLILTYLTGVTSSKFYASGGSFTGAFTTPSAVGVLDLNITYYGSSYSAGIGIQNVVISVIGSSYSSGSLQVIPLTSGGYEVVGYGYYIKNPSLYYMKYSGIVFEGTEVLTNGAFSVQIMPGNQPAGTYSVFTEITNSGTNYFVYSSYSVTSNLTLSSYAAPVGSTITITSRSTGLIPTAYYSVYFGTTKVLSDTGANIQGGADTFKVPTVKPGTYTVTVVPIGQNSQVESAGFNVTQNKNLVLGTDSNYAFPGQLVQFTVSGMGTPSFPPGFTPGSSPTYSVTVDLNGTVFETVSAFSPASGKLSGSFLMPNSNPGSYYLITMYANETVSGTYTIGTTSPTTGFATLTEPFPNSQSDYLGLVSGNGALITGISQSQIVQLETDINATLSVPISQLDASVTSIQNSVAQITTAFGTMQASLSAINATVAGI
ncbi:MAG: hypothetical protein QW393_03245, partial [Candidatus Micrarchaeaceae archaeon]